jgi:hypothetical protein
MEMFQSQGLSGIGSLLGLPILQGYPASNYIKSIMKSEVYRGGPGTVNLNLRMAKHPWPVAATPAQGGITLNY